MTTYLVRLIGEDIQQPDVGLVVANTLEDLYWTLDQVTDPLYYQFCVAENGDGFTIPVKYEDEKYDWVEEKAGDISEAFISESAMSQQNRKWKRFVDRHTAELI